MVFFFAGVKMQIHCQVFEADKMADLDLPLGNNAFFFLTIVLIIWASRRGKHRFPLPSRDKSQ